MAKKKTPVWKELGLKEVKSPSGNRKGFTDKEGAYISERQFRKLVGTPVKGSQGHKERQAAKELGKDFRPATQESIFKELKKAAKQGGMTLDWFTSKKEPTPPTARTVEAHNKFIDKQRADAIAFKKLSGVFTDKQAERAQKDLQEEMKWRDKAREINDIMRRGKKNGKPLKKSDYSKLKTQYDKAVSNLNKAQKKLEKKGIIPDVESPGGEYLRNSYYH